MILKIVSDKYICYYSICKNQWEASTTRDKRAKIGKEIGIKTGLVAPTIHHDSVDIVRYEDRSELYICCDDRLEWKCIAGILPL